ncbi:hypothetical protein I8748_08430 [Nostoc sp. CENA67]|uniref:Uncharacterized protein n=1 Tax=Amazonocrinis nigriterrae CENA67 TaxID=2794033 RepID=A0A8J7HQC5_9NOST|nr:TrbI/VirB10 family protein [Amazonocrinis nigriterrae]MBH8562200.1 hypothetical protein [Amazonocrinis nigriterrae CENA67]
MTSYSISAKNPDTLSNENSQLEVDSSNWESKMARLVGLLEESPTIDVEATEESTVPESEASQPQEIPTQQPLSSNPFAKLALVGGATLTMVMVAGVFLSQLMSSTNQKPANNLVSSTAKSQPTTESRQQALEQEVETLKTKLALAEQADAVTAAQQNLRLTTTTGSRSATPSSQRVQASPASTNRVTTTQQTPVRTVYVPQRVPVERPIQNPPYPQAIRPQIPVAALPSAPPPPVVNPNTQPSPPDPLEQWAKLAKLGSYGQVSFTGQSAVNIASPPPLNNTSVASQNINPNPNPMPQQPNSLVSQAQSQNSKSVKVGTSAKALLATAIFGETTRSSRNINNNNDKDKDEAKNTFVVQLKEPLKAIDGSVALPAKTELLTEVRSISEQGFLQLDVVKIIIKDKNGNISERSLPDNAIIIRGTQGKPLIASKFPNSSSSIASMDAGLFVLGGIGKAAELFNRADTKVQCTPNTYTSSDGSTTSSTNCFQITDNRRNLTAGVVEGGLNSLVPQIAQRNQQAIAQMMQQTNVWFMKAGREVEIYVNQTMQF